MSWIDLGTVALRKRGRNHRSSAKASSVLPARARSCFFFQAEDGIRDYTVTGVQTCALPIYPYAAFNFVVAVVGQPPTDIGGFMEISGLDTENAVIEYREGADQIAGSGAYLRKQPGLERYPNVTMRRGITDNLTLWTDLRQKVRDATYKPQTLKVTLQD